MLTKAQKQEVVENGKKLLSKSESVILLEIAKIPTDPVRRFRQALKEKRSQLQVIKKRLLKLILKEKNVEFDPAHFKVSLGTVFSSQGVSDIAGEVYKFVKENEGAKILGGYNLADAAFIDAEAILAIGRLPSREVLLAQFLGTITAPIRKFMIAISEKAKKVA